MLNLILKGSKFLEIMKSLENTLILKKGKSIFKQESLLQSQKETQLTINVKKRGLQKQWEDIRLSTKVRT